MARKRIIAGNWKMNMTPSEDFDANLGELVDHIVWLSYFLCSQIAM